MLSQKWTNIFALAITAIFTIQVTLIVFKYCHLPFFEGYIILAVLVAWVVQSLWILPVFMCIYDSARNMYYMWVFMLLVQITTMIVALVLLPESMDKLICAAPGVPGCIIACVMEVIWKRTYRRVCAYEELD